MQEKKKFKLDFYTQYSQFYICDKNFPFDSNSEEFWTEESFNDRLAVEKGVLGVRTECYGPVKGELNLLNVSNSDFDLQMFDHVVEASLEISSGVLQIQSCPSGTVELELNIKPDIYKIRIYSYNISSVVDDEGDDYYVIEIWPDKKMERKVLKQFTR